MFTNALSRLAWQGALLATLLCLPGSVFADNLAEDDIKAGYILNFSKYTEWPEWIVSSGEIRICALGSQPLSGKLADLQGRKIQGREIRLRAAVRSDEWRDCQVLFVAADEAQRSETVLRNVSQYPVLTISDAPGFAQSGGVIGMKLRAGRVRFDINQGAARQAGLKLSSQLLKLADNVLP